MAKKSLASGKTASLYIGKSTVFKMFLLGGVAIISAVFIWYTFAVIEELKTGTRAQVEKYVRMWQLAANSPTIGQEFQFVFDEIILKANYPIIVLDNNHDPILWRNVSEIEPGDTTQAALDKIKEISEGMFRENGELPLHVDEHYTNYFRYGDTNVIKQLKMMPFIEIGIVLAFMLVAIIGFQNIRRSEERHIWVGMAKETAHQLGTPISSLMGWIEVVEAEQGVDSPSGEREAFTLETTENMKVDIKRLQKVAQRFGQIGSVPELNECDLNAIIQEVVEYYSRRLPFEGRGTKIKSDFSEIPCVALNSELFSWALENILKNALQAVDSKEGRIEVSTSLSNDQREVIILIKDNGRGVSPAAARKIFRAGFTTKKRGWGLGLTLVSRIVEEYHMGHISLVSSKPGETLFRIVLPVDSHTKTV